MAGSKLSGQTIVDARGRAYKVIEKADRDFIIEYCDTEELVTVSCPKVYVDAKREHQNLRKYKAGDIIPSDSKYLGEVLENTSGQKFLVYDCFRIFPSTLSMMKVRFLETGYETTVKIFTLTKRRIKDYYAPSIQGVAALGHARKAHNPKAFNIWEQMIENCYAPVARAYDRYGGQEITVCDRWLRFDLFLEDMESVEGYNEKAFLASKLFFTVKEGQKEFSLENCHFELIEQYRRVSMHKHRMKKFAAKDPKGKLHIATGIKKFARDNNLNESSVCNCLAKRTRTTQGWTFKYIKEK